MLRIFYKKSEAEAFAARAIEKGGTAEIRKPFGENDSYTEVVWTHDRNKEIVQIIFGWPNKYDVLETIERLPNEDDRGFRQRWYDAYYRHMHEKEKPSDARKVYTNAY